MLLRNLNERSRNRSLTCENTGFLEFAANEANNPLFAAFLTDTTICQVLCGERRSHPLFRTGARDFGRAMSERRGFPIGGGRGNRPGSTAMSESDAQHASTSFVN
jgi:hypothetical protein